MKKSAYIITKPLQYINATNISDTSDKVCLLVDSFSNSKKLLQSIKNYSNHWVDFYWFGNRNNAFFYLLKNKNKFDKIFTDSDNGIITRLFLFLLYPIKISVYEEGFGNYRNELRQKHKNYKKVLNYIDSLMGKNYLGGSNRTGAIYLYHPNAFLKLVDAKPQQKLLKFNLDFYTHLLSLKEIIGLFSYDFKSNIKGKNVIIYLSARKIDNSYKNYLEKSPGFYKVLKPHPEFKNVLGIEKEFDVVVANEVPAELLITNILKEATSLLIIHHGDTTVLNLMSVTKLKEINISENIMVKERFEEIKKAIIESSFV